MQHSPTPPLDGRGGTVTARPWPPAIDAAPVVSGAQAGARSLLRRYEPVLRMTSGELFQPLSVERYLSRAALVAGCGGEARMLAEPGTLDPTRLAEFGRRYPEPLSLRYVQRPMGRREYRAWLVAGGRPPFRPTNSAVLVGLLARLIAVVMRLTLLLRGTVPAGHAAAAAAQSRTADPCHYYGRVSRDGGYVVLQYWFLYPMNDWRSSFGGVNDHEADWEQITLFLAENRHGELSPAWVAFSSHDEKGADLRRRWDDPDLERIGEHPVVYVGAGSHSGAYLPGDYLVTVTPNLPPGLERALRGIARVVPWWNPDRIGFGIPYLDYRRGDGLAIGTGQQREWSCTVIDDDTDWVRDFPGLWGLDTSDPLGGERAPAGPRYERDGRIRRCWQQPVGWAALDGEPPTDLEAGQLWAGRCDRVRLDLGTLRPELDAARAELRSAIVADRMADRPAGSPGARTVELRRRVDELRQREAALHEDLDVARRHRAEPMPVVGVHAHLRHRAMPLQRDAQPRSRLLRWWAAASASIVFATVGLLLLYDHSGLLLPVIGLGALMLVVEATLRGHLLKLLLRVTGAAAAVLAGLVAIRLVLDSARVVAGVLLLAVAGYLLAHSVFDTLLLRRPGSRPRRAGTT